MAGRADEGDGLDDADLHFSLVRDDAAFRLQRALGLIPAAGLGLGRRALFLALITWLPIVVWAAMRQRILPGAVAEPLLQHFGVHVRCLVAIPLLVFSEGLAHGVTTRLLPYFVTSGLVAEGDRARFREALASVRRLRDATLPWVLIGGAVLGWSTLSTVAIDAHEVIWAADGPDLPSFGFGGWWFLFVARPVYMALLLGWLWRLVLLVVLLRRIARIDLAVVPSHPDGAGGLGFLEGIPAAFSLVTFACSAVIASRWAHDVLLHGVHVDALRMSSILFLVISLVLYLAPLLVFLPVLGPARRRALLQYGALVGEQGRLVSRRWIDGERIGDEPLLSAPEIGPVADAVSLYGAVSAMRTVPIGKRAILAIALPTALPLLAVFAIEIPVKDLLMKLLTTLA